MVIFLHSGPPLFYLILIPLFAAGLFTPGLIRTLRSGDRLLSALYSDHRNIWENLGCPRGWSWEPSGLHLLGHLRSLSFPRYVLKNPNPEWLSETPELAVNYREYYQGTRRWNYVAAPICMTAILLIFVAVIVLNQSAR